MGFDLNAFNNTEAPKIKTTICSDKDNKVLLDRGLTINYMYRDKENKFLTKVSVTHSDC